MGIPDETSGVPPDSEPRAVNCPDSVADASVSLCNGRKDHCFEGLREPFSSQVVLQSCLGPRGLDWSFGAQPCRHTTAVLYLYTGRRFFPIRVDSHPPDDDRPPSDRQLYEVRIIDNDYNTYGEVMDISMLALQVSEDEAYAIAWEVDHKGSCVVAYAPREDAEAIASVIRIIGIEVQVNPVGGPGMQRDL